MMKYVLLINLFIICSLSCKAKEGSIVIKSYVTKDSIMLRWSPSSYEVWKIANKYGYKVEKVLLSRNGKVASGNFISILHNGVIKPLAETEWLPVIKKDSVYAPIALQALWGDTFKLTSSFKTDIMQAYNKVRENESRFGFAMYCADRSLPVAKALGVYWSDKIKSRTEKYIYRVYINAPSSEAIDTAYVVIDPSKTSDFIIPQKPSGVKTGSCILLSWESKGTDYVGYHVERSFDGKKFDRITTDIVIPFSSGGKLIGFKLDSLNNIQGRYTYRIAGITPFGNMGPYSDTLKIYAAGTIAAPTNLEVTINRQNKILLSWNFKDGNDNVDHFEILRSDSANGVYDVVAYRIDPNQHRWLDNNPLSNSYYKVVAVSKLGAKGESFETFAQLNDDTPPLSPIGIKGDVDSLGVVLLKWNSNVEKDLLGYRVFRANSLNGEYAQLSTSIIKENSYSDTITLKTLTKKVYYKLAAVDKRYNSSELSEVFILRIPDIVPPSPPVLRILKNNGPYIHLKWISSSSSDVEKILIFRSTDQTDKFDLIETVNGIITEYEDTTNLQKGQVYSYKLCSCDSSGNRSSFSNQFSIVNNNYKNKFQPYVLKGSLIMNGEKPAIHLEWTCFLDDKIFLYRKQNNGKYLLHNTLSDECFFYDINVLEGVVYEYYVVSHKGSSNTVKIKL